MERVRSLAQVKNIMGKHFIGPIELARIADVLGIIPPKSFPEIPFGLNELQELKRDYILLLGSSHMKNGEELSLRTLIKHFGINPAEFEPCFYNQDWYLNESFINNILSPKWFLIRKNIITITRGKIPEDNLLNYDLPSALECAYSFFACWFHLKKCLWKHDYVWCKDFDSNGDRIYVARYYDPIKKNKNGFSIHRHLQIKQSFGCINVNT